MRLVGMVSHRPSDFSWDALQDKGLSIHGWQLDRLLFKLLEDSTAQLCDQCYSDGDCIHNAARTLMMLIEDFGGEFRRKPKQGADNAG